MPMFRILSVIIFFFFSMGKGMSQTSEDSVKRKVDQFITAINTSNGISILDCFADTNSNYQTIFRGAKGAPEVRYEGIKDFAYVIGMQVPNTAKEVISFDVVKVDGPLASVWTSYKFYLDGKLHHCGVNSFQLVRLGGGRWKIQYLIDTRHTDRCQ